MNVADYLKRGFSTFINDNHQVRTIISSIVIPAAASFGYYDVMNNPAETAPVVAPTQKGAELAKYVAQINQLGAPVITSPADWEKLDKDVKDMAAHAVMDTQLSETELKSITQMFTDKSRYRPPAYLWLQGTSKNLSYVSECRQDVLKATGGNIMDYSKSAEQVYACAIRKEDNQSALTMLPIIFGGTLAGLALLLFGGTAGYNWEREFKRKKSEEDRLRADKQRLKEEMARAAALPPPEAKQDPVATSTTATPATERMIAAQGKPAARKLNF